MLARASGVRGMVGGQMTNLRAETKELDIEDITLLQRLKTGALIEFGCEAGAILGKANKEERIALTAYAQDLGLAFQIADDLLDVEGNVEETGKAVRKDEDAEKQLSYHFLASMVLEKAEYMANRAANHLKIFDEQANLLRATAEFVVSRRN